MAGVVKAVERLTGQTFVYYEDLPTSETKTLNDYLDRNNDLRDQRLIERFVKDNPWIEIDRMEAIESYEVMELQVQEVVTFRTVFALNEDTGEVEEVVEEVREIQELEVPTGVQKFRVREGSRLDEATGNFYRPRTVDDVIDVDIADARAALDPIQLPLWVLDRLPALP